MNAGGRFDWEAVRARVLGSRIGPDESAARRDTIFRERAQELAARREHAATEAGSFPALAFALGGERYALALTDLSGVLPLRRYTPVPGAPAELRGVVGNRGRVCSVLDLALLLGLPQRSSPATEEAPAPAPGYILLLRRPGREIGLAVGTIDRLVRIAPDAGIPLAEGAGPAAPYLRALTADRLHLLDADALFSHPLFTKA